MVNKDGQCNVYIVEAYVTPICPSRGETRHL